MNKLTKTERFVLDHYLHEYPNDLYFNEILELIENEENVPVIDKTAMPIEAYENIRSGDLIEVINCMEFDLKVTFGS
jgi:hypothetical protein